VIKHNCDTTKNGLDNNTDKLKIMDSDEKVNTVLTSFLFVTSDSREEKTEATNGPNDSPCIVHYGTCGKIHYGKYG
jgi:hypothetical protein